MIISLIRNVEELLQGRFLARRQKLIGTKNDRLDRVAYHQPRIGHMIPSANQMPGTYEYSVDRIGQVILIGRSCAEPLQ